ncbi:MAG: hypothetical protein IKB86_08085 [Clostridia bacterium]|nr:hypothetical protein [Clostridia bacterium]
MEQIKRILPMRINSAIERLKSQDRENITEIRLRIGCPVFVFVGQKEISLCEEGQTDSCEMIFTSAEAKYVFSRLCDGSPYSVTANQRDGFITVCGNRVGFCGSFATVEDKIKHINFPSSFCIRIKHQIKGCANKIFRFVLNNGTPCSTLIISPPGAGKTTLLRDFVRLFSLEGFNSAVADEREEIANLINGVTDFDLGKRTDVFSGVSKSTAINNMLRSMNPQIIFADELGTPADVFAVKKALNQGVKIFATAHGENVDDVQKNINLPFERYIILDKKRELGFVKEILNREKKVLYYGY